MFKIGCHLSASKGYAHMAKEALSIGAIKYYFDEYAQKFLNIIFDKDCK